MLSPHARARFLAGSWQEIVGRLARNLPLSLPTVHLLQHRALLPAGNTLAAFGTLPDGSLLPLRPNCAILELTEDNLSAMRDEACALWRTSTGVGFNVSQLENPVQVLRELQELCARTEPQYRRPKRGNMAVLSARHPRVAEFIDCKGTEQQARRLELFNISVSFDSAKHLADRGDLLTLIARRAWATGCPGVVLEDRLNETQTRGQRYRTVVPCGEQAMFHGETCTLASVNLHADWFWQSGQLQTDRLREAVAEGVHMLETTRLHTTYATPLTAAASREYRRVGLGVTGFADALRRLGLVYGSPESVQFAGSVAAELGAVGRRTSQQYGHISTTCLPPTGGVTLLTPNAGFAIEPAFDEAANVAPIRQMQVVQAFQQHLCNSVSKTLNLPALASTTQVADAFLLLEKLPHVKSLTVYRDRSRLQQPRRIGLP